MLLILIQSHHRYTNYLTKISNIRLQCLKIFKKVPRETLNDDSRKKKNTEKMFVAIEFRLGKIFHATQPAITYSYLTMETLEQGVEYVQS